MSRYGLLPTYVPSFLSLFFLLSPVFDILLSSVNGIGEIAVKKEVMNIFEYSYEKKTKDGETRICFQWVTDLEVSRRNLEELVEAGHGRWKIENEGFNNQKNGIYRIEHLNSRDRTAMKNHYRK